MFLQSCSIKRKILRSKLFRAYFLSISLRKWTSRRYFFRFYQFICLISDNSVCTIISMVFSYDKCNGAFPCDKESCLQLWIPDHKLCNSNEQRLLALSHANNHKFCRRKIAIKSTKSYANDHRHTHTHSFQCFAIVSDAICDRENVQSPVHLLESFELSVAKWNKIIYDYLKRMQSQTHNFLFRTTFYVCGTSTQCQGGVLVTVCCITHVLQSSLCIQL